MSKLKIAIQKKGRLNEKSLKLLKEGGIKLSNGNNKLKTSANNGYKSLSNNWLNKTYPI